MDIDGIKILNWIQEENTSDFLEKLRDCSLSNEISEWTIMGFSNKIILVRDETADGKITQHKIEFIADKTLHIPSDNTTLLLHINDKKNALDLLEENTERILRKYGIPIDSLGGGANQIKIANILLKWDNKQSEVPSRNDLFDLYDVCTRFNRPCLGLIKLFNQWKTINENEFNRYDALIRLNLAVLNRIAHNFQEALAETENEKEFKCDNHTRAMICCDRAAIYLDLFQKTKNKNLLNDALKNLKKSYANEISNQVRNCWARYETLRNDPTP